MARRGWNGDRRSKKRTRDAGVRLVAYRLGERMPDCFDRFASAIALLACLPLFAVLVPLIRWTSPGPAFFRQTRVGRDETPFVCYKLRTMAANTKEAATHEVSASSVTPVGAVLRRTKLDELPQLWNVLRGEMRLVGPRPCLPVQTALIEARRERGVFSVVPGITGLAQVEGIDMSDPERLARRDGEYVAERSLGLDFWILWATVCGKGREDRVRAS